MKGGNWGLIGVVVLCLAIVLLAGCGVSKSDYETLQAELDGVQSDLTSLQADYEAISNELAQIKEVYPPRDFSSVTELEDWLLENDVSEKPVTPTAEAWYGRALEVQEDALADGYVVSVDYDYISETEKYMVYCVTIINGDIYYWDPETDEVQRESGLLNVK
jgi:hypothetical protein